MSLIPNLYLIGISGKSERMRYGNNSNYEVIRRQGFIVIQWMPTSTSIMKGWFYPMIKSLRCTLAIGKMDARKTTLIFYIGVNSRIVSIYYRSISNGGKFIYDYIDIYKYCKYRINDTHNLEYTF